MEDQLPYRAEYAKTGRAMCKGCKTNIGQSSLRLAVMVQSAFHDGKQPNWFHMSCFFKKQRPKTVGDIAYFENLKYEDQNTIKEKISTQTEIVVPVKGAKGKKRTKASEGPLKDFGIEYSKSSRAECCGCLQKIMKGEVRVKKVVYDTEIGMKFGGQALWHHVECFEKIREELDYYESGDKLTGFKDLKKEDQANVKNIIKPKTDVPLSKKLKAEPKDEVDMKVELENDKKLINQNKEFYKNKENLKSLKKKELIELLQHNHQYIPEGNDALIDTLADNMTFGCFSKCKKCKVGSFVLGKNNYVCNGNLTEWVKCMATSTEPSRFKIKIPKELKKTHQFLSAYKPKIEHRVFQYHAPSAPSSLVTIKKEENDKGPRVQREKPKLYQMEFVLLGDTVKYSKEELKSLIAKLGGHLKTKIHSGVVAIISTKYEIERMGKRMEDAKALGIHVVTEEFFDKVANADPVELLTSDTICDWGTDPLTRIPKEEERKEKKSMYSKSAKSGSSKVTLKLKGGGGAVDPDSQLEDVAHVFESNDLKYNAVLTKTDIQTGKNSYYKLQVLQADKGNKFWLFRAWGRIGTTIGGNKIQNFDTQNSACKEFCQIYEERTQNTFGDKEFLKVPGFYQPVDIDYSETAKKIPEQSNIKSALEVPVQELIKLLFDVDLMKKVMLEFELDTEKMPLGKLSKKQLDTALTVLNELSKMIENGASQHEFIGASNHFYTLIPHDFGINQPPLLDTNDIIKSKVEMLDSLMEIELAYNLLNDSHLDTHVNPIDAHYAQLKTELEPLDKSTKEFELLKEYVKNTHAETHNMYDLEIVDIFKTRRQGEEKRYKPFKKLHNRKLLWHGSRLTNYVGILSHGLKIAPAEAPVSGYMFGKGIYFADMVSKSANYCFTSKANNTGLLMLCEVALGNMEEYTQAHYVTKLPKNKHSTKGIGKTAPDPKLSYTREDGVEIPYGTSVTNDKLKTSLLYNEYIVYDVAQIQVQYLFKVKFNYKY